MTISFFGSALGGPITWCPFTPLFHNSVNAFQGNARVGREEKKKSYGENGYVNYPLMKMIPVV